MSHNEVPTPKEFMGIQLNWIEVRWGLGCWTNNDNGNLHISISQRDLSRYLCKPTPPPWSALLILRRTKGAFRDRGDRSYVEFSSTVDGQTDEEVLKKLEVAVREVLQDARGLVDTLDRALSTSSLILDG